MLGKLQLFLSLLIGIIYAIFRIMDLIVAAVVFGVMLCFAFGIFIHELDLRWLKPGAFQTGDASLSPSSVKWAFILASIAAVSICSYAP